LNDGLKHGYLTVEDHSITLNDVRVKAGKKGAIEFNFWVSIEFGYGKKVGDLTLSVPSMLVYPTTSGVPSQEGEVASCVIAHVKDPIDLATKVSDLKIGYQYQPTADIEIVEQGAGYLLRDKQVLVSITDGISSDMWFTPDTKIAVVEGNLIDQEYHHYGH